ncbi:hypothetical protein ACOMHN_021207 [Nucella lapillus]
MRDIVSPRATGKDDKLGRAENMAATNNTESGVVVGFGGGGNNASGTVPSSPVPDWAGDSVMLKEFATKRKVPGFARVVKGSYMTIGSSKFSLQKQHHEIYVHSVKMGVKVLAHCVKRMDIQGPRRGQVYSRLYSTDQRLTVPLTYQGWFELLSEDGKSARPIISVPELAKIFPARCLVRENIKAYSSNEGRMTFDKTKVIPAGEQLKLCGELSLPSPSQAVKVKLLRCIDSKGDNVFLSFDQKGLFTPISGENDFTGVFNIRDIVRRFRLPLTVKLVQGVRPRVPDSKFTGIIRLDWVYTEETAFVCPLEKNHVRLLPVPCDVALQMVAATNQEELCASDMFKSIQAKCARMVSNYNNTLHLIVNVPESVMKTQARNTRASNFFTTPLQLPAGPRASAKMRRSRSREDMLMDEIDDLYGYVRDGGAVPPKVKFQYDSDEESYWEEPAYEPLDEFRARLKAMESGQKVSYPAFYRPADPTHLKGLVGGLEPPAPLPPECGSHESLTPKAAEPPPLPPRPSELASPSVSTASATVSTDTFSITVSSASPDSAPNPASSPHSPIKLVQSRRVSAPLVHTQELSLAPNSDPSSTPQTQRADSVDGGGQELRIQRVSRSDSDPSISSSTFPASPVDTRPRPTHARQQSQGEAVKLDWKERLRRFNAMEGKEGRDKEGSSSASSGSMNGQKKVAQRLARDFKDSDISSRTKASSGSDGRGVRKRMQTLYL